MSLLDRILGRAPAIATPARREPVLSSSASVSVSDPQAWQRLGWTPAVTTRSRVKSLPPVSALAAQRHATVFACCNNLAGDMSKVPLHLFQRDRTGREVRVREHAAPFLLNVESTPGVAAMVTRFALIYAFALRGNGFAYAPRDGAGNLMMVEAVKGQAPAILKAGRDRFYDFEDGAGMQRRVPWRHMVHMRYLAEDGWTGRSPIEVAAESMGIALAGQEAAARTASGSFVRAVIKLKTENYEDAEAEERAAKAIAERLRNPELDGFPVMAAGDDLEKLDLSASDQQLLESRKFDLTQICAIYRMPPSKVQSLENGVKANVEQQAIDYLTDCLMHWAKQVEDQLAMSLLTPAERTAGLFFRHDFDALLRPTTKDRYDAYFRAVGGPIMTPNEARAIEGLDPIEAGKVLYPPSNMTRDASATTDTSQEPAQ
jgi:HK97 family phage portal protein